MVAGRVSSGDRGQPIDGPTLGTVRNATESISLPGTGTGFAQTCVDE